MKDFNKIIRSLREDHAAKVEQMEEIHNRAEGEKRKLTNDEQVQWDGLRDECVSLDGEIRRNEFLSKNPKQQEASPGRQDTEIGLTDKEVQRFSFMRAFRTLMDPRNEQYRKDAAFEIECSEEAAKRSGTIAKGIMVPVDVIKRDLNAGTPSAGGNAVATDLAADSFIEVLRNRLIVNQLGSTVLDDLRGDLQIPRQDAASTGYWIASEGGAPSESQQTLGQVAFTPRTVGAFTDYTRQFLMQSAISVENFVRNDLAAVLARAIDLAAIYGSGASGQPTGITNTTGINTVTFGTANKPTFAEIIDCETQVAADNADAGTMGYAFNATMRGHLKSTEKFAGTGQTIWEPGNTVNGYNSGVSNQMAAGDVVFGNWADLILAYWGGLDLTLDPYSQATSGTMRVIALQSMDVGARHAVSFCHGKEA